ARGLSSTRAATVSGRASSRPRSRRTTPEVTAGVAVSTASTSTMYQPTPHDLPGRCAVTEATGTRGAGGSADPLPRGAADVGARVPPEPDPQMPIGELFDQATAPFDHHDGVGQVG